MHSIDSNIPAPETLGPQKPESSSLKQCSSYEVLRKIAASSEPATENLSSADNQFANRALRELTASIQGIITERRAAAKETFRLAVKQFEAEVLPWLTSDLKGPHHSAAAVQLEQVLERAIRDDLVTPFIRGSGAVAFSLLEYVDRYKSLERTYPGVHALVGDLKARGLSIDADVESACEAAVSSLKRISQLQARWSSIDPGKGLLASALLSLPAIADQFPPAAIHEALQLFQPRYAKAVGLSSAPNALPRPSADFAGDVVVSLQANLSSQNFITACEFIQSPEFIFAARLNAGRFDRIRRHVEAFCAAVRNPYGESPESIGKECVHSLCQEFKSYRDDFILWRFPFSKGAAQAIRSFEADSASRSAAASTGDRSISWYFYVFRSGFTPRDPDGERVDLCLSEPRFFALGAQLRRGSDDLLPILKDLTTSEGAAKSLSRSELEPLRLFLLGHAVALLTAHPSAIGSRSLVHWVSLNTSDIQRFGGLLPSPSFRDAILATASDEDYMQASRARLAESAFTFYFNASESTTKIVMEALCTVFTVRTWGYTEAGLKEVANRITGELEDALIESIVIAQPDASDTCSKSPVAWDDIIKAISACYIVDLLKKPFDDPDHHLWKRSMGFELKSLSYRKIVASLEEAGYTDKEIWESLLACQLNTHARVLSLLHQVADWKVIKESPLLRPPVSYLFEMGEQCNPELIHQLNEYLSDSPLSVWRERISAKEFVDLFQALFDGTNTAWLSARLKKSVGMSWRAVRQILRQNRASLPIKHFPLLTRSLSPWTDPVATGFKFNRIHRTIEEIEQDLKPEEEREAFEISDISVDERRRFLTMLVHYQRANCKPILEDALIAESLAPESRVFLIKALRPDLTLAMCADRVKYNAFGPLHAHILSEEIDLLRFQPECNLLEVLKTSCVYLAAYNCPQARHRIYPSKSVTLASTIHGQAHRPQSSSVRSILNKHELLFTKSCELPSRADLENSAIYAAGSPIDAAAVGSLPGLFFLACAETPFERREFEALFNRIDRLDFNTLARYIERLVDALDGGFHNNIELTYRNKPLAKALAKELKLDVLMAELRSHYDAGLECQPGPNNLDVTFMPTIGWLMEVSGAISGSCVGKLTKIAETYTEGVFVPFVVQGDPPHFSGGSFVFEGILANGEKVMVIRGFNPRTFLLSNVRAGDLFEAFADYVAEMGQACGATRVVLPQADFWHNPATLRSDVHFYFQDNYMKKARMKLGDCQVKTFNSSNSFSVDFVVEVRRIKANL